MGIGMDFIDISRKLTNYGWKIEGTIATSIFRKREDDILYRYRLDLIYKSAVYEQWQDEKRIKQDIVDYNTILERALRNEI